MPSRLGFFWAAATLMFLSACGRLGYDPLASSARTDPFDGASKNIGDTNPDAAAPARDAPDDPLPSDKGLLDADTSKELDAGYVKSTQTPGTSARYIGTGVAGFDDGSMATATVNHVFGLLRTSKGVFIADTGNAAIRLLRPNGQLETVVGRAGKGFKDGPADQARLLYPVAMTLDLSGRLLIADERNHAIRRLNDNGTLETIAGTGAPGFKDGPAAAAQFNSPRDLLIEKDGSLLIADKENGLIRRLRNGNVSVVCGKPGETPAVVDGDCSTTAKLQFPVDIEFDSNGDLLVSEWAPNVIRRITSQGQASTWAGKNNVRGYADGKPANTILSRPSATVTDTVRAGVWIIEQEGGHRIRFFDGFTVNVVAGPATAAFVDGSHKEGANPTFAFPETAILDEAGCLLVAEGIPLVSRYCP